MLQTVFGGSRMDVLGKSFPDVRSSDGECSHWTSSFIYTVVHHL